MRLEGVSVELGPFLLCVGFDFHDEDMRQLAMSKDPRLLDALARVACDWQDIKDAYWISESGSDFDYAKRGPDFDLDEFIEHLQNLWSNNSYVSESDRPRIQCQLDKAMQAKKKQVSREMKKKVSRRRRSQFGGKRDRLLLALIERDSYVCKGCGLQTGLQIDHILPLSKGGSDELENLRLLCSVCNSSKSDKIVEKKEA